MRQIYIAGSSSAQVLKIGTSEMSLHAINQMNLYSYGGYSDWRCLIAYKLPNSRIASTIEQAIFLQFDNVSTFFGERNWFGMVKSDYLAAKNALTELLLKSNIFSIVLCKFISGGTLLIFSEIFFQLEP